MEGLSNAPSPKTSLPNRLLNGNPHDVHHRSPLRRTSVNARERDKLTASIKSSNSRRQPINLDADAPPVHEVYHTRDGESYEEADAPTHLDVSARDPTDESSHASRAITSRPASPYTQNPPIDFDGLSWPSELPSNML